MIAPPATADASELSVVATVTVLPPETLTAPPPKAASVKLTAVVVAAVSEVAPTEVDVKVVKPVQPDVFRVVVEPLVTTAVSIPDTVTPVGLAIAEELVM